MYEFNEEDWERVEATVDSGTIDHVGPKTIGEAFPVRGSDKSRAGFKYRVANGEIVSNEGKKWLEGYSDV